MCVQTVDGIYRGKVLLVVVYGLDITLLYVLKGKAVPLQAWSGPEGSRNLRFPNFITTV